MSLLGASAFAHGTRVRRLDREFKMAEQSYGTDHLDLVLAKGFLGKLLANAHVIRYLSQHHQEILSEFHKVADLEPTAA